MSHADDVFYRQFGAILAFLVVFGFAVFFIASAVGTDSIESVQSSPGAIDQRIAPVGSVSVAMEAKAQAAPVAAAKTTAVAAAQPAAKQPAAAAAPTATPESMFKATCVACHGKPGLPQAPKLGDAAEWGKRMAGGIAALYEGAIKGKGNLMPPRGGGASLSDDDIKAIVRYMLEESGVEVN